MDGETIHGTCRDMCPKRERYQREQGRRLSVFEIDSTISERNNPRTSADLCVKEYVRSAAGSDRMFPDELRSADVLLKTVSYLLEEIFINSKHGKALVESCHFVSDRIRAVRQDMFIQQLHSDMCLEFLAMSIRYHILLPILLHRETIENFDPKLNRDQLQLYLSDILDIFKIQYHKYNTSGNVNEALLSVNRQQINQTNRRDELDSLDMPEEQMSQLWIEFEIYNILVNIDSNTSLLHCVQLYNDYPSHRTKLKTVLDICLSYVKNNYYRVLKLCFQLRYLEKCCLVDVYDRMRYNCLEQLNVAYSVPDCQFPVDVLLQWLKFLSREECCGFCQAAGLHVTDIFVKFSKKRQLTFDNLKRSSTRVLCKCLAMLSPPQYYRQLVLGP